MSVLLLLQVKLLGGAGASALTLWAQDAYAVALAGAAPPLLAGLRVSEQPAYPLPQVRVSVCLSVSLARWWWCRKGAEAQGKPEPRCCLLHPTTPALLVSACRPSSPAPRNPPQALCGQLLREMDPESGIEDSYKRVAEDPVYRWRLGRTVAAAGA